MNTFEQYEVWFVTGAQLLYGGDAVIAVDAHSNEMVKGLNDSGKLPVKVVYKGTVNSSKEVTATFKAANNDDKCIGVITWMHTFSPAKMWIHGLQELKKPLLHFHTQFNKEIPWETMDMDFMNLNQSAHGDREFGHIVTRMRKNRKVVVGHWQDEKAQNQIAAWMRVAAAWADAQDMLIIRFGDQMKVYQWEPATPEIYEELAAFNENAMNSLTLGYSFNSENVATEVAAVTTVITQYLPALECGMVDDVDAAIATLNEELEKAGLSRIIEENQRQLNEWMANQ